MTTETQPEVSPRDRLTQAAAREFYLSSIDETRAHRREHDRLAFLLAAFLLADTHYDPTHHYGDVIAAVQYANEQYVQAVGEPMPIHASLQGWSRLRDIASASFLPSRSFHPADNNELAQAILEDDESRVKFAPIDHYPQHPSGHAA